MKTHQAHECADEAVDSPSSTWLPPPGRTHCHPDSPVAPDYPPSLVPAPPTHPSHSSSAVSSETPLGSTVATSGVQTETTERGQTCDEPVAAQRAETRNHRQQPSPVAAVASSAAGSAGCESSATDGSTRGQYRQQTRLSRRDIRLAPLAPVPTPGVAPPGTGRAGGVDHRLQRRGFPRCWRDWRFGNHESLDREAG